MQIVDIMLETTWATTTGAAQVYIPLPAGLRDLSYAPTTQWLLGGGLTAQKVSVKDYAASGVTINKEGNKLNTLRLRYLSVGELVRT